MKLGSTDSSGSRTQLDTESPEGFSKSQRQGLPRVTSVRIWGDRMQLPVFKNSPGGQESVVVKRTNAGVTFQF